MKKIMNLEEQRKCAELIFTERGFDAREHSIKNIIGDHISPCLPHVTAIGTSGGKTYTTAARLEFLYKYGFIKPNEKVIIIAADKSILRRNFIDGLNEFFESKPASFTYCAANDKHDLEFAMRTGIQVIITLPQTISSNTKLRILSEFNWKWLIQDEAHKWYFKDTVQNIIDVLKPTHQSLLTGTPFKFNAANYISTGPKFTIEYTSVREMYQLGYLSDFTAQVLHSDVSLKQLDYVSMLGNLKTNKRLGKIELESAFNDVVEGIIKKLKLPGKSFASTHNITKNITAVFGKLEKSILFAHGIPEADCLAAYLRLNGVGTVVTHSETGIDSNHVFDEFKNNDNIKVLVAVNQGKEGFDFPELYNVIDMTFSQNFEVVMQMIGRILRKSKNITNKYFFKVAPKNQHGYTKDWLNALFMLFDLEWYSRFNGKNGFDIPFPSEPREGGSRGSGGGGNRRPAGFKPTNLEAFLSLDFMERNSYFKLNDSISTVATTTLREICAKHAAQKLEAEFLQNSLKFDEFVDEFKNKNSFNFFGKTICNYDELVKSMLDLKTISLRTIYDYVDKDKDLIKFGGRRTDGFDIREFAFNGLNITTSYKEFKEAITSYIENNNIGYLMGAFGDRTTIHEYNAWLKNTIGHDAFKKQSHKKAVDTRVENGTQSSGEWTEERRKKASNHTSRRNTSGLAKLASNAANNVYVICPDGHGPVTRANAGIHCKKHNLDYKQCKEIETV